jgi:hypothetical protein
MTQKEVNFVFNLVLAATSDPYFCQKPRGERMAWVANNLRAIGIDTHPIGMSWGYIVDAKFREHTPINHKNLEQ